MKSLRAFAAMSGSSSESQASLGPTAWVDSADPHRSTMACGEKMEGYSPPR